MSRLIISAAVALLAACSPPDAIQSAPAVDVPGFEHDAVTALEEISRTRVTVKTDLLIAADTLAASAERFLAQPNENSLQTLRAAWETTHRHYAALSLFPEVTLDTDVDQWPIEPGYLDSLPGYPESGIIHDLTIDISPASLREQDGFTDPTEASLGFHPLEFLIFRKTVEDYSGSDTFTARRRQALAILTAELKASLEALETIPDGGNLTMALSRLFQHQSATLERVALSASALDQDPAAHPGYVVSSPGSLEEIQEIMNELYAPESALLGAASRIDKTIAAEVRETLDQSMATPASGDFVLPLQLAALSQQLAMLGYRLYPGT